LVQQNCKYKFEVIVCDDGSAEDTKGLVDNYLDKLDIRYCFQEDKGFRAGQARNMGIKLADGEICIFIDNGIILHTKAVERHIDTHKKEAEPCLVIGYVYGFMADISLNDEMTGVIVHNAPDEAIQNFLDRKFIDIRDNFYHVLGDDINKWPAPFVICWTCNMSVRKEILFKFGMFDEFFVGWGCEDIELGINLYKNNVHFVLQRDASSIHFPHEKEPQVAIPHAINKPDKKQLSEILRIAQRMRHIKEKHPSREVEVWLEIGDPLEVNNILLGEGTNSK